MYSILQAKQTIMDGIRVYLAKDSSGKYLMDEVNCLPFYLEGAPGIGKTQIVNQIAREMELGYVSFSLVHHTRNSLLGLPVISELDNGDKYTSFTISEIIAKVYEQVENGYEEGILLLDEFPCMSETIMPAMLAFLQTKNIGTHALPRGWVVVLCGNPAKYNKSTHSFDAAVTDRIRKIEIEYKVEDFLEYANENNLSQYIVSYLEVNPNHMYRFVKDRDCEELVTCRSWENLSHTLTVGEMCDLDVDEKMVRQFLKSDEIANNFTNFYGNQLTGMEISEALNVLKGVFDDKVVNKYKRLSLSKKWNLLAYIKNLLVENIGTAELLKEEVKFAKRFLTELKGITNVLADEYLWFYREVLLPYSFGEGHREDFYRKSAEAVKNKINNKSRLIGAGEEVVAAPASVVKEWCSFCSDWEEFEDDYDAMKFFIENLETWLEKKEQILKEKLCSIGSNVDHIFEFVEEIDDTNALSERFYVDVCNTPTLLKAVVASDSKKFANKCCEQYGVNVA